MSNYYIPTIIQKLFQSQNRYKVAYGGRSSGKSFAFAAEAIIYALEHPKSRILCCRGYQNKIEESSLQTLKTVIILMELEDYFNITEKTLSCKNGSEFIFYGLQNYMTLKSLQSIDITWVDEAAEIKAEAWIYLIPTVIRKPGSELWISFNPDKDDDWVYQNFVLSNPFNAEVVKINYYDNALCPQESIDLANISKENDLLMYNHIWEGDIIVENPHALWKRGWIKYTDSSFNIKDLSKIIVSIDPSGTNNPGSDEVGIVVAGRLGLDPRNCFFIVLGDYSGKYSPASWAERGVSLYEMWNADYIVYEKNYGGDIVRDLFRKTAPLIPLRETWSSKGKLIRATPVSTLYELDRVRHIKAFPLMEKEMLLYDGTGRSPNRLDALVFALTDLSAAARAPNNMTAVKPTSLARPKLPPIGQRVY